MSSAVPGAGGARGVGLDPIAPPPDLEFAVDALTGLIGRRYFRLLAEPVWDRHRSGQGPLSLLIADIDACQRFNGDFGHWVGDRLIVHVADLCLSLKRPADLVARTQGDAFTMLLPGTGHTEAASLAERLCRLVETSPLDHEGQELGATVSIGVATAGPATAGIAALVEAADAAMHEAKAAGRNRVAGALNE